MIHKENNEVKKIDNIILEKLKEKLKMSKENVNILEDEQMEKVLERIDAKKQAIFLLFQGNFSTNEYNVNERLEKSRNKLTMYDKLANSILFRRVETLLNQMMDKNVENKRLISVCMDRKLFIQKILDENVEPSTIRNWIEDDKEK